MQGNHACNVEAPEIQANLLGGNTLRANPNPTLGLGRLLGLRRRSSHALQRAVSAPENRVQRHRGRAHAHPSGQYLDHSHRCLSTIDQILILIILCVVYYIWVCLHTLVLCVGKVHWCS